MSLTAIHQYFEMEEEITQNLTFLTENLNNLTKLLLYLSENQIISQPERQEVETEITSFDQNIRFWDVIQKKDWPKIKTTFLEMLRNTNNEHCADRIERVSSSGDKTLQHSKILNTKWWPEKRPLIESLLKRKHGSRLLIEELHDLILNDVNRMAVICESSAASKNSGFGGVGKTVTAKWYSYNYEDFYDYILWIDSGDGSLLQSFENLARDLKVSEFDKLVDIEDYSRKCYEELKKWRCLWIFDNASSYKGDNGIFEVLPNYQENFYCLITSRSRDWGVKNVGMGRISDLQLDIFSENESLEFFKAKLDQTDHDGIDQTDHDGIDQTDHEGIDQTDHVGINQTNHQLKELCGLLGNLPLALELTLAALKGGKIDIMTYIKKISENDFAFVDPNFDVYESTINKNIQISIDIISKEEDGKMANEILMVFGYIRPDDIPEKFIETIFNSQDLKNAIELLIKYSLISKESRNSINFLSIHRLLQQVIRPNCRITLAPSSKLWKSRETKEMTILKKIFSCEGFTDFKLISFVKYADEELRKKFPKLKAELLDQEQLKKLIKGERFEEAVELAKFIDTEFKTKTTKFNYSVCLAKNGQLTESAAVLEDLKNEEMDEEDYDDDRMGMLKLKSKVSGDLIFGHLLIVHCKLDNRNKLQELLENRKQFKIVHSSESLGILIRIIHLDLIQSNYSLVNNYSTIEFKCGTESNKIELTTCSLDLSSFDHRLSPTELTLWDVSFTREGQKLEEVTVDEFIDLEKITRLTLRCYRSTKMCIDLSGDVSLEYLYLHEVRLFGLMQSKWNILTLELRDIPIREKTKMTIKEMKIWGSSLDISCLPPAIQELNLTRTNVVCRGELDLPNLNYLTLKGMSDCSVLSSFQSLNITHVHFFKIKEVNVDSLPKSVTHIKITGSETIVIGEVKRVHKLILEDSNSFSFHEVEELLSHLKTDDLVVYIGRFTPTELIELSKKKIKRIAVGRAKLDKEDLSILSSHVDGKEDFYLWEGAKRRGIEKEEFEELMKLY